MVDAEKVLASGLSLQGPITGDASATVTIPVKAEKDGSIELESAVFYCLNEKGVCLSDPVIFQAEVVDGGAKEVVAKQDVKLKKGATSGITTMNST